MQDKVYKLVRVIGGRFYSLFKEYVLEYEVGQVTEPEIEKSGIFCFQTWMHARMYSREIAEAPYGILACRYEVHRFGLMSQTLSLAWPFPSMTRVSVEAFWRHEQQHHSPRDFILATPPGTIACSWVEPLEVLEL